MSSLNRICRLAPVCAVFVTAACGEDPRVTRAREARQAVDAVAQQVRAAPHVRPTGRWSDVQLTERLINAGLAPRADDSIPTHASLPVKPVTLRVGKAHLVAWIFADSVARRAVSAKLDTLGVIQRNASDPYSEPPMVVMQNNLIAALVGGSDRQRERVRLAIEAGLPLPR